jgi:hypothetical protein
MDHDMGRRQATEKELESSGSDALPYWNTVFDESGNFLVICIQYTKSFYRCSYLIIVARFMDL